jgi:hypothetical protein
MFPKLAIGKCRPFNMGAYRGHSGSSGILSNDLTEEPVINIAAAVRLRREREPRKQHGSASRAICFFAVVLAWLNVASAQSPGVLSLDAHIPLPGVKGRIDHFSVDVRGQRLFVAAVENHTLEVIDLKSGHRVHTISDLAEPQGVFYDPTTSHLFVACADGLVLHHLAFSS